MGQKFALGTSKLDPFSEDVIRLSDAGFSQREIAKLVFEVKGLEVSRMAVQRFLDRERFRGIM